MVGNKSLWMRRVGQPDPDKEPDWLGRHSTGIRNPESILSSSPTLVIIWSLWTLVVFPFHGFLR